MGQDASGLADVKEFRAQCARARNTALATLCTRALTGDEAALRRVNAIMHGDGDPVDQPLDPAVVEAAARACTRTYEP